MKEYIERAAAMESIFGLTIVDSAVEQYANAVYYNLQSLPAADVVKVVRCKNCRFFSGRQECYCHAADENGTPIFVREDDFCSYGARIDKEDEHEAG